MQQGKVMIVTGASSGFGELTALTAAREGYRVVVTARRAERLEQLVQRIEAAGGTALAVAADVTNGDDQHRVIETTLKHFGRIDVLVNNAGVPLRETFVDSSLTDLRRQWDTNVLAIVELTKHALPALIDAHGVVINIGSIAGHFSLPGWGMYYPTKVAVASISESLRRELSSHDVQVCLVEPGPYATEFGQRAGFDSDTTFGFDPQQIADVILRLCKRPKRRVIVPWWTTPFVVLAAGGVRLLPGLVDLLFRVMGNRQQRRVKQPKQAT